MSSDDLLLSPTRKKEREFIVKESPKRQVVRSDRNTKRPSEKSERRDPGISVRDDGKLEAMIDSLIRRKLNEEFKSDSDRRRLRLESSSEESDRAEEKRSKYGSDMKHDALVKAPIGNSSSRSKNERAEQPVQAIEN